MFSLNIIIVIIYLDEWNEWEGFIAYIFPLIQRKSPLYDFL